MSDQKNGKGPDGHGPHDHTKPQDQSHEHGPHDHAKPHDHAHAHGPHDHSKPHDHSHAASANSDAHTRGPHEHVHEPHARHEARGRPHAHAQPHLDPPNTRPELKAAGQFERVGAGASSPSGPSATSVPEQHKARGPRWAKVYVITCSDSRTEATDEGGRYLRARLADGGHVLSGHAIVRDEPALITAELDKAAAAGAQAVLLTGGTGLSKRDSTFEAVSARIVRPLPGFGELFRMLSHQQIGASAMLSRATAGVQQDGVLVFAMPGSPAAVRLACDALILPELTHLIEELNR
jgi:molybdenum cofactor biosynthesis protein B